MLRPVVEQCHLAKLQFQIDGLGLIDSYDRLAAGRHMFGIPSIRMIKGRTMVGARQQTNAATLNSCRRQRQPGRQQLVGFNIPAVAVLMPGYVVDCSCVLDEPVGGPTQDIATGEGFDYFTQTWIPDRVGKLFDQQLAF